MKSPGAFIPSPSSGFTLIEVLVVLGIFGILLASGLVLNLDFYKGYVFRSERNLIVSVLAKARAQSLSNISQAKHGVRLEAGKYTIFEGQTWLSRLASQDEVIEGNLSLTLRASTTLPLDIVFSQLAATTTNAAISISSGSYSGSITINEAGQINW